MLSQHEGLVGKYLISTKLEVLTQIFSSALGLFARFSAFHESRFVLNSWGQRRLRQQLH